MTPPASIPDLSRVALIIPALNEEKNLSTLLPSLSLLRLGQIIVCDNGSTDATRDVTQTHQALWVYEPQRGYGAACYAGMRQLDDVVDIIVFADADQGDDAALILRLVEPIVEDRCDVVIGARVARLRERGAATWPQRFANRLLPLMIRLGWGHRYSDLGPFRAIRRSALEAIDMQDRAYGWTVEMQIRAVELGLRIGETEVPHRKRRKGRSTVSGAWRGVLKAGYGMIRTCITLWLTRSRRE